MRSIASNESFSHYKIAQMASEGGVKETVYSITTADTYESEEIQRLLGIPRFSKQYKGPYATPTYEYTTLTDLEKHVYLRNKRIFVLTDRRILELQQQRPVDQLALLIKMKTQLRNSYEELYNFIQQYGIREVCVMLIQILADSQGPYLFSRTLDDQVAKNATQSLKRQSTSQPRQNMSRSINGSMFQTPAQGSQELKILNQL